MTDAIREAVKDIKFYLDRIQELTNRNKELEAALRLKRPIITRCTWFAPMLALH